MTSIVSITAADRAGWQRLWDAYLVFYEETLPEDTTDDLFLRLVADDGVHGVLARDDAGTAVGLVHWLLHPSTWATTSSCYLEDLFVAPEARGGGVARALIEHVRARAAEAGAEKVYWLTQESNTTARALYDKVATSTGFVHYETRV